jgi:hypothetical protein
MGFLCPVRSAVSRVPPDFAGYRADWPIDSLSYFREIFSGPNSSTDFFPFGKGKAMVNSIHIAHCNPVGVFAIVS